MTAPRSPTTTGKIERWRKTLRREFLDGKVFDTVADAQDQLNVWVRSYNEVREHQSIGNVPPIRRFELRTITAESPRREPVQADPAGAMPAGATRRVSRQGTVSFGAASYFVARHLAGEEVVLVMDRRLVQIHHRGVLVATHARRHAPVKQAAAMTRLTAPKPKKVPVERPTARVVSVTRKVDSSGNVCFAAENYYVGVKHRRRQVQVAVVGDTVEISIGEQLIRSHPVRHDRTRQHGALANPGGRARRSNAA